MRLAKLSYARIDQLDGAAEVALSLHGIWKTRKPHERRVKRSALPRLDRGLERLRGRSAIRRLGHRRGQQA